MRDRPLTQRVLATAGALIVFAASLTIAGVWVSSAPAAADTTITFTGGGWGHAVGMSQWGAKARADAGQSVSDIFGAYYPGAAISGIGPATVRVDLADTDDTLLTFTGAGLLSNGGTVQRSVASGETVEVRAGPATFYLVQGGSVVATFAANETLVATWDTTNGNVRVGATGNRYKSGRLAIRLAQAGAIQVVNESLTMQQYLNGLGEVPSSWPSEALKAQAIAGRTYAYRRILSPRAATYDLVATTADQVYVGYEKEAGALGARWLDAVAATDGQILTYGGSPIQALYYSSNGGYTEDASYVFVSDVPYLHYFVDPYDNAAGNGNFRWTRSYSGTELAQYLKGYRGVDIGMVTAVDVAGTFGRSGRIDRATMLFTGTGGTTSITGSQLRDMISRYNDSLSRQLPSTLLFFKPIGSFDGLTFAPDGVRVTGWSAFQGSQQPAITHVYVNGVFRAGVEASQPRPDVPLAIPGATRTTGYDITVPVDRATNTVCTYAVTPNGSAATFLGCRDITVPTDPMGAIDLMSVGPDGLHVAGWTLDPNSSGPNVVHVYVNGQLRRSVDAARQRPDIATAFPGYGAAHGYNETIPLDATVNNVCVYSINIGPGDTQLIGCRTIVANVDPFGSVDVASGSVDGISLAGWAIDPNTADPIGIHVYIDGKFAQALRADGDRPDVAAAFPGYGAGHGYDVRVPAVPGNRQVCAYGINTGPGSNALIGCRTVFVPGNPIGSLDVATATPSGIRVAGWSLDPNTSGPISVHIYVGTVGTPVTADRERPDLAASFPGLGTAHGFDVIVPGNAGQQVCAFGINVGPGANALIGCRIAT